MYGAYMRAITYRRVSTADQADSGAGLDAQADRLTAAVTARGWSVVADLADEGASGKRLVRRPALTEAMAMLDRGEADALVVAKLDRLARSVADFARITETAKRRGWSLVVLDVDLDMSTPTGLLVANVLASVAQWEGDIISARTADALAARKARGVRLGRPVELAQDVRQRIADERAGGDSLRVIADRLNTEGVPTARGGRWHASTVRSVLGSLDLDAVAASA